MSRSYEWNVLGRAIRLYRSSFAGERGYEKGWHGRLALYLDESCRRVFGIEYHVPSKCLSVRFSANHDDSPIQFSVNLLLAGAYFSFEHPLMSKLRDKICSLVSVDGVRKYSGREFSVSVHDHAVWWEFGADDMGWSSKTPRWRKGAWHPIGRLMRQGDVELIEEREVLVPMPERSYKAKAKLERTRWGFTKLPRYFDRIDHGFDIQMLEGEQIPFPGKGENAWDCDDDAAFGMSGTARTIEDGIGRFVASVLRDRHTRGWRHDPGGTKAA